MNELDKPRAERDAEAAAPVQAVVHVRVELLNSDLHTIADMTRSEVVLVDPTRDLDEDVTPYATDLGSEVGEALDAFAQAEAWGR